MRSVKEVSLFHFASVTCVATWMPSTLQLLTPPEISGLWLARANLRHQNVANVVPVRDEFKRSFRVLPGGI